MLELKSVKKSFGGINVFEKLTFQLEKGERVGLTGGNGTGKSTLINLATGFLLPDEGEINFRNSSLLNLKPWQIAKLGVRRNFQSVRLSDSLVLKDQFFGFGPTAVFNGLEVKILRFFVIYASEIL